MKTKYIVTILIGLTFAACKNSGTGNKEFEHNYAKYWEKYSEQKLIDALFSDTLRIGFDIDGGRAIKEFYIHTTKELILDLQDDKNKIERLFPMKVFDKVTIEKLTFLKPKRRFSHKQVERLLEILNDPLSFDWAETTTDNPEYRICFLKNNNIVALFTICESVIETNPNWPNFKKMKFGNLKTGAYHELKKIIHEVGL